MLNSLIQRLSSRYSIRQKIVIGFGGVILLNLMIGGLSAGALYYIDRDIHWIVDDIRPAREKSYEMQHQVLLAKQGLGFYLLNPMQEYRDQIDASMAEAFSKLKELEQMPFTLGSSDKQRILKTIQLDLNRLYEAKEVVYSYEDNAYENMPGLKYADEQVLPINSEIFNLLHYSDHLDTMADEDKETITQLASLWNKIELQLKDYLLHRDAEIINAIQTKLVASQTTLDSYASSGSSLFKSIKNRQGVYQENLQSLIKIHGSENWRKDRAYLKNHINPIVASIKKNFVEFNNLQKSQLAETVATLHDFFHTSYYLLLFVVLASLAIGVMVSLLLIRDVSSKMRRIVNAMEEISENGNLNQKLDEEGKDEMAQLASSFNSFVTKIKGVVDLVSISSTNLAVEASTMS
ncbi:MAG: HAMP domain-containing protein, partial [Gammaproteobacteria bacterium]